MRFDEIFSYTLKGDEISDSIFIFCTTFKKCTVHQLFSLDWKADGLWFHAFIWGLNDEENILWDLATFKKEGFLTCLIIEHI
mgnify:CR=1 FL=1